MPYLRSQPVNVGIFLGGSNYAGDLTEDFHSVIVQTRPALGIEAGYWLSSGAAFKIQYWNLRLHADDAISKQEWKKIRNFNFTTLVHEVNLGMDFYFFQWIPIQTLFQPYFSFGLSFFGFNPRTKFEGRWIDLVDVGTEGQGMPGYPKKYDLFSHAIGFGTGINYAISSRIAIGVDIKWRRTQTDYLDDLSGKYVSYDDLLNGNGYLAAELGNPNRFPNGSQRGNDKDKDWFQTMGIHLQYFLKPSDPSNPASFQNRRSTKLRCPSF
ncbi:MAG: hypothetical protein IPM48_09435 [Saprospiraceae bacterium]|nr:hypothetical protein [Saprospiraceae bacterium]